MTSSLKYVITRVGVPVLVGKSDIRDSVTGIKVVPSLGIAIVGFVVGFCDGLFVQGIIVGSLLAAVKSGMLVEGKYVGIFVGTYVG